MAKKPMMKAAKNKENMSKDSKTKMTGMTEAQKKLPPALQAAIMKKKKKKM